MKEWRGLSLLLLCCVCGVSKSFGFLVPSSVPQFPTSQGFDIAPGPGAQRVSTFLKMGLGSFVKKRFLRGNEDDDSENPRRPQPAPPPVPAQRQPPQQRQPPPPQQQQRQARPASGMQRSQDPGATPRADIPPPPPSRRQMPPPQTERPLQPSIAGPESAQQRINRVKQGKMTEEEKQRFLATTLQSSMKFSKPVNPSGPPPLRQELANENSIRSTPVNPSATPFPKDSMLREVVTGRKESPSLDAWSDTNQKKKAYLDMVTDPNRFSAFNAQPVAPPEPEPLPPPELPTDYGVVPSSPLPTGEDTDSDLASRLEAGAFAEEQRQREMRRQVEEQKELERLRQIELRRQREEELAMREAEALRKKREAMERAREESERKLAEEKRKQEEMMQAQQEYWKKKLEDERQRKLQKLSEEDRLISEARAEEEARLAEEARLFESMGLNDVAPQQTPLPPVPSPAVPMSFNSPLPVVPDYAATSFADEQELRLAAVEAQREEQLAKLKALNSPLPSSPPANVIVPATYAAPPPLARPAPPPATQTVGDLSRGLDIDGDEAPLADRYVDPAPAPSVSVMELMKQKNARDAAARAAAAPAPAPKPAAAEGGSFLGRMFSGDDQQQRPPPAPQPQERRVVRQPLPLEDDDFDSFSRTGPNKHMSIKDAMQSQGEDIQSDPDQDQRSKMWGVDMSRFSD